MHFFVGVIIPNQDNVQNSVASLLAPYDENIENNKDAHWDWWEIGGRWDGVLKGENEKPVLHIHDIEDNIIKISEFLELDGIDDRLRETINKMLNKTFAIPYAIVSEAEGWVESDGEEKLQKKWEKEAIEILKRHNGEYLVCVDCHC
jgi:hypothetical protein